MSRPREDFFFFGPPGQRLFGVLHAPPAGNDRNAGWVLCSAFGEEHDGAQRNMVEWARFLSDQGFWVFRFDYRGSGNSEGVSQVFTFDDNLADVRAALREMEHRSAVPCCGMCGLRLGGALAVMAALQEGREMPLVLWEPVVSGEQYTDELFRMAITTMMMQKGSAPLTRGQLRATLAAGDHTAVRGHIVNEAVYSSLVRVDLLKAGRPGKSPVLIVQISNRPRAQMKPALEALYNAYAPGGPTTMTRTCIQLPWSLTNKEYSVRPPELFEPTRQWIMDHAAGRPAGSPPSCAGRDKDTGNGERRLSPGSLIERPVEFPIEGKRARGVLHIPKDPGATKPVIILPVMSALFQVKLARELGQHGWTSLRFDPRGKGDSEGDLEFSLIAKLHIAVQDGLLRPDVGAAVDFLEQELGAKRAIIIGICGDAITAVYHAAIDQRVVGIAPMELPVAYTARVEDSAVAQQVSRVRQFVQQAPLLNRVLASPWVRRNLQALRWRWRKWAYALKQSLSPEPRGRLAPFTGELGDLANVHLIDALVKCVERPIPMLCVFGGQRASALSGFKRILPALRRVSKAGAEQISLHVIEGADHHFSVPEYTVQVFEIIVKWLEDPHQPWADEPAANVMPSQLEQRSTGPA
jgi:pimeloyl-ACP methyl ester carboxylesterase